MVGTPIDPLWLPEPGTGWIVAKGDADGWSWTASGRQSPSGADVDDDTWFDLASLTKVLLTVPLVIRAVSGGALRTDTTLGSVDGRFADSPIGRATVAELLTHTSGAPPELPRVGDLDDVLADVVMSDDCSVVYSDVGFIALGRLLELVSGSDLWTLADRFAADMGAEQGVGFFQVEPQRWASTGVSPPGRVHDPAARALGRLLGHAGCFATVIGARQLLEFWLTPEPACSSLVASALTDQVGSSSAGHRGWGWALPGDDYSCAPDWPPTTVSHTGFTGTALAFDPESGSFAVILTNAVADGSSVSLRWLRSMVATLAPSRDVWAGNGYGLTMTGPRSDGIGAWSSSSDMLANIQAILPSLPPSQHRVGAATLADPALTAASTISELAKRCDTSETSVLRFCRTLGFDGYPEFRIAVAAAVGEETATGRVYVSGEILEVDSVETVIQKVSSADALAVLDTARHVDTDTVEAVAKAIADAGRVEAFGAGASSIVGADLHQKLSRIGITSSAWLDPHGALMSVSQLGPGDVAIAISHSGETTLTVRFLEAARDTGAVTVALTNVPGSVLAGVADYVMSTSVRETAQRSAAMASRLAQLSLLDIVFTLVARSDAGRTQRLINATYESVKDL